MTPLETLLSTKKWCYHNGAFTTVVNGYGFGIYRVGYAMRLSGLSKEVTAEQLKTHNTQPPALVGLWERNDIPRLFDIQVSPELVSAIVMSTYPELTNDLRGSVPSVRHPSQVLGRNAGVRPGGRAPRR